MIPGNDEAIRSIRLIASTIADSILEGRQAVAPREFEAGRRSERGEVYQQDVQEALDSDAEATGVASSSRPENSDKI